MMGGRCDGGGLASRARDAGLLERRAGDRFTFYWGVVVGVLRVVGVVRVVDRVPGAQR